MKGRIVNEPIHPSIQPTRRKGVKKGGPRTSNTPGTRKPPEDEGDFLLSATVAAATDSTLIGYAVGGDLVGALFGDAMSGDDSDNGE